MFRKNTCKLIFFAIYTLAFSTQSALAQEFVKRINSGGGQITTPKGVVFEADNSFSGNLNTYSNGSVTEIQNTTDDILYFTERSTGSDDGEFEYSIALDNGEYEVKLHFAEIYWGATIGGPGGGPGRRVFNIEIEGQDELTDFDINAEAGAMTAIIKSFNVTISDGQLNMRFYSSVNQAKLSGIEIFGIDNTGGDNTGDLQTLARINCGGNSETINGIAFGADQYAVNGGQYSNSGILDIFNTDLDDIYKSERNNGGNGTLNFEIPVTEVGNYTVKLHFAEIYFGATGGGGGNPANGERVFNVQLEGNTVLESFDAKAEANGSMTAVVKTFEALVNDGVINIDLTAISDQPKISAIEVLSNDGEIVKGPCDWRDLADSIHKHIEGQSATANGKFYIFGGFLPEIEGDPNNSSALYITNNSEMYDPVTDSWQNRAPMPTVVTHAGMQTVGDEIWIIGGFVGNNPGVATDVVQIYNTVNDSWTYGTPLPKRVGSIAAVLHEGKVHVYGGLKPGRKEDTGDHYVFDANNPAAGWIAKAPMPEPRNHHGGAVLNGLIYAIGGQTGHDYDEINPDNPANTSFVHVYNPQTDSWTRLGDLPTPRSHFEASTLTHNGKIMIAGGNHASNDVLQYDPTTDQWTEYCKLPSINLTPSMMIHEDKLIITNGGVPNNWNPTSRTRWVPIEASTDAPEEEIPEEEIPEEPINDGDVGQPIPAVNFTTESAPTNDDVIRRMNGKVGYLQSLNPPEYMIFEDFDFGTGASSFTVKAASGSGGSTLTVNLQNHYNPVLTIATVPIPNTGGWNEFQEFTVDLTPGAVEAIGPDHRVFLVLDTEVQGYQYDIEWFRFNK